MKTKTSGWLKMLFPICVIYILNFEATVRGNIFNYEYTTSDNISESGLIYEMSNIANRIHCATACFQNPECKGFGYSQEKDCLLFGIFLQGDYCSKESCKTREGVRIYMVSFTSRVLCHLLERNCAIY